MDIDAAAAAIMRFIMPINLYDVSGFRKIRSSVSEIESLFNATLTVAPVADGMECSSSKLGQGPNGVPFQTGGQLGADPA
jgi:hypothetical protein